MLCMLYDNNSDFSLYYIDDVIILNNCSNMLPVLKDLDQFPIYQKRNITVLPHQRLLVLKQCQRNSTINQTEPTKSRDDPRVPNYSRKFVAPSAQSTALHGTITRYLMEASCKQSNQPLCKLGQPLRESLY